MGESLDDWREFFRTTDTDVLDFIEKAITIAALDCPKDFLSRRGRIAERLFSCTATGAGGHSTAASKESKAIGDRGNAAYDVLRTVDVTDPRNIGDGKTSSDKNQNIGEPRQEKYDFNKAGSLAKRNQRLNVNRHAGIVKPNMSSNTDSRTNPASKVASWKFKKKSALQSRDSNGSVAGCKRPLANQHDIIEGWNEVVGDMKFGATKRKMQELYQKAETDKRQRTVQVLDPCDLPKMAASHKAPCATTAKARRRKVISRSQVSCI